MNKRTAVVFASVLISVCAASAKDIFLLIGQSNMAGRGWLAEVEQISSDRIEKLDKEDKWVPATEPLHFDKPIAGAGLGLAFARAVADRDPSLTIGLVPCAVGGSALDEWLPGAKLYTEAIRRAKIAQKDGEIKGILWHQGESDADRGEKEKTYNERLAKMVKSMRSELGLDEKKVPFVFGEIAEYQTSPYFVGNRSLNRVMAKAVELIPNSAIAKQTGLRPAGDKVHFEREGIQTLGLRYAKEYLRLAKGWTLSLRNLYSDHMLFQREQPIVVAGEAKAGAKVEVAMNGASASATADEKGRWTAELAAMKAGGPYELVVKCAGETIVLKDVLIGELWVASGQSNMEMPIWGTLPAYRCLDGEKVRAEAKDDKIRLFNVQYAIDPDGARDYTLGAVGWQPANTPNAVGPFSASGYFFAVELRKRLGDVPVGVIGSNWGGTRIEPWIPEKAFRDRRLAFKKELGYIDDAKNFRLYDDSGSSEVPKAEVERRIRDLNIWEMDFEQQSSKTLSTYHERNQLSEFQKRIYAIHDPRYDAFDWDWDSMSLEINEPGVVWFRWHFTCDAAGKIDLDAPAGSMEELEEQEKLDPNRKKLPRGAKDLVFAADSICDLDDVYFDGTKIGGTTVQTPFFWKTNRCYRIARPERGWHSLSVRVQCHGAKGWLRNPRLEWKKGTKKIDLAVQKFGRWTEARGNRRLRRRPATPWDDPTLVHDLKLDNTTPSALYNAMIAPLTVFRPRGVIWYQGGSNRDDWLEYDNMQRTLVKGWREAFHRDDLAFICTELAGFIKQRDTEPFTAKEFKELKPTIDTQVRIRAEQEKIREVPGCDAISAIDIGDAHDVHPKNKREVGRRFAATANTLCYGGKEKCRGPQVKSIKADGSAILVTFDEEVVVKDGSFGDREFCLGDQPRQERDSNNHAYFTYTRYWATAKQVAPDTIRVESPALGKPSMVDWGRQPYCPKMSIFNKDGFPATPFIRVLAEEEEED